MPSIKLVVRKSKERKRIDGFYPISIRIIKDRKTTYISTGQYTDIKYWDNGVKSNHPEYNRLSLLLGQKMETVRRKLLDEEIKNPEVTTRQIKEVLKRKGTDFFAFAERIQQNYTGRTLKNYTGTINKLQEFHSGNLSFNDLTLDFLLRFEAFLRGNKNNVNTIAGRMTRIKTILHMAYKSGEADRNLNPFIHYKVKTTEGAMEYLTEKEVKDLRKIKTKDKSILQARDIFLFQFNCWGMRISDALSLKWNDIDRKNILRYKMIKTKKQLPAMELTTEAIKIIGERKEGYVFNYMGTFKGIEAAEAYVNRKLKKVAELAGITKNLSTHVARHTWTSLAVDKIGNTWLIKDMLGHSSIVTTQRYAKRFNGKEMNEANKKIMR